MSAADVSNAPILEMRNISKTFGSVSALDNVSFTVFPGEIHTLMGENGAGKSTLMKILSGAYTADPGGTVLIDGEAVETGNPKLSRELGIAVIYQELSLAPNLTVAENMFLGNEPSRFGLIDRPAMRKMAKPVLEQLDVSFNVNDIVSTLSLGERQEVEIARALASDARILVMDEPTTSLSLRETENIFAVIQRLKAQGITFVYISHRMQEIYQLSDRCSVLRDGQSVGTLSRDELTADRLVSMMVGRDLASFYKKEHRYKDSTNSSTSTSTSTSTSSDSDSDSGLGLGLGLGLGPDSTSEHMPLLSAIGLSDGKLVNNCSLTVNSGEVLGISGLVGSGRTELARLIYGADALVSGQLHLNGVAVKYRSPREALANGVAYLTEDRKALGMFLDMSISENINISVLSDDARLGCVLNFPSARKRSDNAMSTLSIRAVNTRLNTGALSGGNQQKVLLARLLETHPKLLILDEPTRGVDVGAKSEIYRLIDTLSEQGIGIIVISSDLPEIIGICDRILVMRDGQIQGEVQSDENASFDQEKIMMLSTGALAATA